MAKATSFLNNPLLKANNKNPVKFMECFFFILKTKPSSLNVTVFAILLDYDKPPYRERDNL